MNHYLIFSAINDYFKEISSLDAGALPYFCIETPYLRTQ